MKKAGNTGSTFLKVRSRLILGTFYLFFKKVSKTRQKRHFRSKKRHISVWPFWLLTQNKRIQIGMFLLNSVQKELTRPFLHTFRYFTFVKPSKAGVSVHPHFHSNCYFGLFRRAFIRVFGKTRELRKLTRNSCTTQEAIKIASKTR